MLFIEAVVYNRQRQLHSCMKNSIMLNKNSVLIDKIEPYQLLALFFNILRHNFRIFNILTQTNGLFKLDIRSAKYTYYSSSYLTLQMSYVYSTIHSTNIGGLLATGILELYVEVTVEHVSQCAYPSQPSCPPPMCFEPKAWFCFCLSFSMYHFL